MAFTLLPVFAARLARNDNFTRRTRIHRFVVATVTLGVTIAYAATPALDGLRAALQAALDRLDGDVPSIQASARSNSFPRGGGTRPTSGSTADRPQSATGVDHAQSADAEQEFNELGLFP